MKREQWNVFPDGLSLRELADLKRERLPKWIESDPARRLMETYFTANEIRTDIVALKRQIAAANDQILATLWIIPFPVYCLNPHIKDMLDSLFGTAIFLILARQKDQAWQKIEEEYLPTLWQVQKYNDSLPQLRENSLSAFFRPIGQAGQTLFLWQILPAYWFRLLPAVNLIHGGASYKQESRSQKNASNSWPSPVGAFG